MVLGWVVGEEWDLCVGLMGILGCSFPSGPCLKHQTTEVMGCRERIGLRLERNRRSQEGPFKKCVGLRGREMVKRREVLVVPRKPVGQISQERGQV